MELVYNVDAASTGVATSRRSPASVLDQLTATLPARADVTVIPAAGVRLGVELSDEVRRLFPRRAESRSRGGRLLTKAHVSRAIYRGSRGAVSGAPASCGALRGRNGESPAPPRSSRSRLTVDGRTRRFSSKTGFATIKKAAGRRHGFSRSLPAERSSSTVISFPRFLFHEWSSASEKERRRRLSRASVVTRPREPDGAMEPSLTERVSSLVKRRPRPRREVRANA
jgi:hypothetical protein